MSNIFFRNEPTKVQIKTKYKGKKGINTIISKQKCAQPLRNKASSACNAAFSLLEYQLSTSWAGNFIPLFLQIYQISRGSSVHSSQLSLSHPTSFSIRLNLGSDWVVPVPRIFWNREDQIIPKPICGKRADMIVSAS